MIESINNERVKYWTKLNEKKYQDQEGKFLVEGGHLVEEAFKAGYLEEVIVLSGSETTYERATFVSEKVMKKITTLLHFPSIIGVAKKMTPRPIKGNVIILDKIQDPGNLGTIIRSAVAFGIDTIVLGRGTVSLYNPKVVRATEGLLFHINVVEEDIETSIVSLKNNGYKIYTTDVEGGTSLKNIDFPTNNTAIIMGNEGIGVSENIRKFADERIYIEMEERCESLNVGIATSIILYELYRTK